MKTLFSGENTFRHVSNTENIDYRKGSAVCAFFLLFCCSCFCPLRGWWSESSVVADAPERQYSLAGLSNDQTSVIQPLIVSSIRVVFILV